MLLMLATTGVALLPLLAMQPLLSWGDPQPIHRRVKGIVVEVVEVVVGGDISVVEVVVPRTIFFIVVVVEGRVWVAIFVLWWMLGSVAAARRLAGLGPRPCAILVLSPSGSVAMPPRAPSTVRCLSHAPATGGPCVRTSAAALCRCRRVIREGSGGRGGWLHCDLCLLQHLFLSSNLSVSASLQHLRFLLRLDANSFICSLLGLLLSEPLLFLPALGLLDLLC
mmetsp:Transcript_41373/g.88869  ORF Transcript_41373/g.88869 Transcript_41373/m.88869 type:complete len:223 (-) Transcript_41373:185-853(-)